MNHRLREQRATLTKHFELASVNYQEQFSPQIEAAAHGLYAKLEEQPVLLNSLRAARVTTDAAAVALAVKSGGLAAADLVVAPAMLSVTTLLTESVLGRYMDHVKQGLKAEQRTQVRQQLLHLPQDAALILDDQLRAELESIDADDVHN